MGCNCGQRRVLTAQALNNLRKGNVSAARQNAQSIAQSMRQDLRKLGQTVRSSVLVRPPR